MPENFSDIIATNQTMISAWKHECLIDSYCAIFMICMDMREKDFLKSIRLFASEGMPIDAVMRNLRHIADMIEQSNFKKQ